MNLFLHNVMVKGYNIEVGLGLGLGRDRRRELKRAKGCVSDIA